MIKLALTVTIKPNLYRHNLSVQYDKAKKELTSTPFKISLVSEVTKSGNLHLHGIIEQVKAVSKGSFRQSVVDYFRTNKVIGYIYLKEITELDVWLDYCFKDFNKSKLEFYFAPIVMIDEVDDFPKGIDRWKIINSLEATEEAAKTKISNKSFPKVHVNLDWAT